MVESLSFRRHRGDTFLYRPDAFPGPRNSVKATWTLRLTV